jgi:Trk K+ transport system NAD-binding subunit
MTAAGRRIQELHLPPQALITSVRRADGQVVIAHGETLLQPGDTVVVLTQTEEQDTLRQALIGEGGKDDV